MSEVIYGSTIKHEIYGKGKVVKVDDLFYKIDFGVKGVIDISKRAEDLIKVLEEPTAMGEEDVPMDRIEKTLTQILEKYLGITEVVTLGEKWQGGTMILQPGTSGLKSKEIPIETFFHKIVMLRDRLRVLEQQINSHSKLTDEDKVNMQQYITRCYGSMTTFNVLFKNNEDYFVGEKTKE
jgi:hypothetical protein